MMHTAACHIRIPAYRHKTNTAIPISSAAEMLTVKADHLLSSLDCRSLGRGQLSGAEAAARLAAQPPDAEPALLAHPDHLAGHRAARAIGPLRHPVNFRPILITSRHRSLAFCKVRSAKNAALPDTIGSGKHRVPFRAAPPHSSG